MTFFRLAFPGKGWRNYTKAAFFVITETQFAIQSHVTLRPNSTERLLVDATKMRCFQAELFSRFLMPSYAGHVNLAGESLDCSCKIANMAALLKSLFFVFNISFLRNYHIKYYDYIVKW